MQEIEAADHKEQQEVELGNPSNVEREYMDAEGTEKYARDNGEDFAHGEELGGVKYSVEAVPVLGLSPAASLTPSRTEASYSAGNSPEITCD